MSDIKNRYLLYTVITMIFGIVYEIFSHQVYTPFMYLAFTIPLIGFVIFKFFKLNKFSVELLNLTILSFTIGSIFKGVLYIYGTTNNLCCIYLYMGIISLIILIINEIYQKVVIK